jgi:hypothetical protein
MGCFFIGRIWGRVIWLDEANDVDRYVIESCSTRFWYAPIDDEL